MSEVKNPCIQVCRYDDNGICIGCFRTMQEAADWMFLSSEQKREVIRRTEERKNTIQSESNSYDYYV